MSDKKLFEVGGSLMDGGALGGLDFMSATPKELKSDKRSSKKSSRQSATSPAPTVQHKSASGEKKRRVDREISSSSDSESDDDKDKKRRRRHRKEERKHKHKSSSRSGADVAIATDATGGGANNKQQNQPKEISNEAIVDRRLRKMDRSFSRALKKAHLAGTAEDRTAAMRELAKLKVKRNMVLNNNLVHFPSLCSSCGRCTDDDCGCNVPRVPVRDGSSHCQKPILISGIWGYAFNVLGTVPAPAIPFVTNWDNEGNLVVTPAAGFLLANVDAAFGFNRTFSDTARVVVKRNDTVFILNMPTETLNQQYLVERINTNGYTLKPTRFSTHSCESPRVGSYLMIVEGPSATGGSRGIYQISALTECTKYITVTTTFNETLNFYQLQHVACSLAWRDPCDY